MRRVGEGGGVAGSRYALQVRSESASRPLHSWYLLGSLVLQSHGNTRLRHSTARVRLRLVHIFFRSHFPFYKLTFSI